MARRLICTLVAAAALLAACSRETGEAPASKASFNAVDITGANYARSLSMTDVDGKPVTLADFRGKVTLLFFGFTHCPDVCPTTLADFAEVKRALGSDGDQVQAAMVSVDPERDTPELLKRYVTQFDPGFVALRGTPEQTFAAGKEFKVFFAKSPTKDGGYSVDHTAGSFVFDRAGRVRLFVRYGAGPKPLLEDVKRLLAEPS